MWIEKGDPIPTREIKSTHTKVMVWGGVWYNGKSELAFLKGRVDHRKYIEVLGKYLLPTMPTARRFLFQQDGAGPHRPEAVREWLREHAVRLFEPWPANSPDFSPIEHVWSWMEAYVKKEKPYDRDTLVEAIRRAWDAIPQRKIQGYFDGLPARLEAVFDNGGARLD